MRAARKVRVLLAHAGTIDYGGITRTRVDREGNLRLYRGWHQDVFHPAGEWLSATIFGGPTRCPA